MATVLAAGTTATTSSDIVIAAGGELDLYLTTTAGSENIPDTAVVLIQKKSGSDYVTMFKLSKAYPSSKLKGVGTWRVKRGLQDLAVGVDSEA